MHGSLDGFKQSGAASELLQWALDVQRERDSFASCLASMLLYGRAYLSYSDHRLTSAAVKQLLIKILGDSAFAVAGASNPATGSRL